MIDLVLSLRGVAAIAVTIVVGAGSLVLKKWITACNYYKGRGIPGPTPIPFLGNLYQVISVGMIQSDLNLRKKYGRVVGTFEGSVPVIHVSDVGLIKNILIKDFHQFNNRRSFEGLMFKPLDKILTVLKDDEWKNVRSIVSGAFSSGKLKLMSKCMDTCIKNYTSYLDDLVENHDGILDTSSYSHFTLDVICACSFGIDTDSIKNPNNDLLRYLKNLASPNMKDPRLLLAFFAPKLASILFRRGNVMSFLSQEGLDYLENLVNQVVDMRTSGKEKRNDFIQMVLEYQQEEQDPESFTLKPLAKDDEQAPNKNRVKKVLTNSEILSQSILFVLAGFETTSSTLKFMTYNIATHAECQEKLIAEIDRVLEEYNGQVTYESVSKMTYLDMVMDETLRLYPGTPRIDRTASADHQYGDVKINKGDVVCVPIYVIHHDPDIFPEPEEFRPERFSEESKKMREGELSFLGFGAGPRNCVASRFAYLEVKLLFATILSKYTFTRCEKTVERIELDMSQPRVASKHPIIVKLVPR